MLMQIMLSQYR